MKRSLFWSAASLFAAWTLPASAQYTNDVVKLGVATDMSSLYADINGPGAVIAAQMAIDDFGGTVPARRSSWSPADVQNKADVAATIAGRWYDAERRRDHGHRRLVLVDRHRRASPAEKKKIFLATDPASSDLTGPLCNRLDRPLGLRHLCAGQRDRLGDGQGGRRQLVLPHRRLRLRPCAASATSPRSSRRPAARCWASVKHPLSTQDFSSFLLQAQASKAKVIGLANAGQDTINSIKQAGEFGIVKGGQKLAGLLVFATDVQSLDPAGARRAWC